MSLALDARRLFRAQQHATLGTLSTALAGYPYCSVVPYVLDHQARPIILVSRLAEQLLQCFVGQHPAAEQRFEDRVVQRLHRAVLVAHRRIAPRVA